MERTEKDEDTLMSRLREMLYGKDTFSAKIEENVMDGKQLEEIAIATDGFSGREIAKLMIALQGEIYASAEGTLTRNMIENIVQLKVTAHDIKKKMGLGPLNKGKDNHSNSTHDCDDNDSVTELSDLSPTPLSPTKSSSSCENDLVLEEEMVSSDNHRMADANKKGCSCVTS